MPWTASTGAVAGAFLSTGRSGYGVVISADARLDVWYQPTLLLTETFRRGRVDPFAWGGRVEVSASVRPTPQWPVFATGTLGYKTDGFVRGEGLDSGILVEVGLRLAADLLE